MTGSLAFIVAAAAVLTAARPAPPSPPAAAPAEHEQRREIGEQVLRGTAGETSLMLELDEPGARRSTPTLELALRLSGLVDQRRSTLTISIDDRPLLTQRLANFPLEGEAGRRLALAISDLGAGFHALRLTAHLVPVDDECEQDGQRRLWLRANGALRWRARVGAAAPALPRTPAQTLAAYAVAPELVIEGNDPADTVAAYLEGDRWRRRLALPAGAARPRLRAMQFLSAAAPGELLRALLAAPAAIAIAGVVSGELIIVAAPGRTVADAVRSVASALRSCTERLCWFGPTALQAPTAVAPPAPLEVVVRRLGQELPDGFLAQGSGRHVLRWRWQRPTAWTLVEWPELRLQATASTRAGPGSTVTIRLDDIPLATYPLSKSSEQLVVRLPPWAWARPSWLLTVEVRLLPADEKRCAATDEREVWLHLAPESSLAVPRDQPAPWGLAAFFAVAEQPVIWVDATPTPERLERFAAIANQAYGAAPWRAVRTAAACGPRCLALRDRLEPGGRLVTALRDGQTAWLDRLGATPITAANATSVLQRQRVDGRDLVTALLHADAPAPDVHQLHSDVALWAGAWLADEPPAGRVTVAVRGDDGGRRVPVASSRQERSQAWLDAGWLAAIVLAGLLLLRWIFRARAR